MYLSRVEKRWLSRIMEATIPPGGVLAEASALDAGGAEIFEDMVRHLPFTTAAGLRAAVIFIEFLGPALGLRRPGRFSSLDRARGEQCLGVISKNRVYLVRNMAFLVKTAACMAWGADERVREALGCNLEPRFVKRSEPR